MIDWMKYRLVYFLISGIIIAAGVYGLIVWGLPLGLDFKGGALLEYKIEREISTEEATQKIEEKGIEVTSVQRIGADSYLFRLGGIDADKRESIKNVLGEIGWSVEELRFESVGPSIGPELVKKTIYALAIAAIAILVWITIQFKSFKFGVSAVLAMLHDSLVLIGVYGLFGHFLGAEVDFLFVTAMLTILSFSVHDTIVVYDRIRESQKKFGGSLYDLANKAVTETMVRSLNNSFTIIFMLIALVLLGGTTIKWFAIALLIGTISGTYSSPFVAVPLLVTWDELQKRLKR
ncbi:protein-export membrane protein SecF [Candidatus Woesebacteria bacterium RBG_19FT_COMBO_42_9]|nr:MAG: protein-export membrane protein SecF [Candidatus Woesebacteria bacterium RBG_19FT_COMBO_42_9]